MKVLIVGDGISGRCAEKFLIRLGYKTSFALQKDINGTNFSSSYLDRLFDGLSFIVISPGIPLDNQLIVEAKKRKIKVIGELELSSQILKGNIIAITGTNGKTTTTKLIYHLLKDYSSQSFIGGNIGIPVSSFALDTEENDISVLEVSSYQLESISQFCPHIACVLNISEDHLARHKSMKNYLKCKLNITKNQTGKDFLIINADDEILMRNLPKTKAKIFYFSTKKQVTGCYIKNKSIYFNDNNKEIRLASLSKIKLIGEHNLSNIVCSVLAVYLQTGNKLLFKNLQTFEPVEHRIEFVKKINGISFYNDSKATNIDSTIVATKCFSCGINLILGGSDKGYEFDSLFQALPKNIKNIAVFGQTKFKIACAARKLNYSNFYICEDLESATKLLFKLAEAGEIVLLSPACASFDFFANYEERGNFFKKIVREIDDNENSISKLKSKK